MDSLVLHTVFLISSVNVCITICHDLYPNVQWGGLFAYDIGMLGRTKLPES